jgi:hypothetical protein
MSEERIKTDEELAFEESELSAEDLDKIAAGLAEERDKVANSREQRSKT